MTDEVAFLYVTAPDAACARRIADRLVDDGVAACVNIFPGVASVYRWRGAVERADECVVIVKCARSAVDRARAVIQETHPYETPSIACIAIDKEGSSPAFLRWVIDNSAC